MTEEIEDISSVLDRAFPPPIPWLPPPLTEEEADALFSGPAIEKLLLAMLQLDVTNMTIEEQKWWLNKFEDDVQRLMDEAVQTIIASRRAAMRKRLKLIRCE